MKIAFAPAALVLLLAGCNRVPDTPAAIKQGVIKDLQSRVDVNNMDVEVGSVSFRGKEADAVIAFSPKGQPGQGMQMKYTMEKRDDGWHIKGRQGNAAAHGGGMQMREQPGEGGQGELPAGHPPVAGGGSGGSRIPTLPQDPAPPVRQ